MNNLICCYIDHGGNACSKKAEWAIVSGPSVDEYTESCQAHVGNLLTDATEHKIYPIS